ncbi:MAG: hypothetical protein RSG23_06685 [Gordonibacter sp.]|uniref:hypothetical protein n=1 Tax=Gordonibacter sp. TaxID=1968902 RepID=UPI002FC9ECCB
MEKQLMADDNSLLGRVFSLVSREAQTLESLSSAMDVSLEDMSIYWVMVNKLRRSQGHSLPVPPDMALPEGACGLRRTVGGWYAMTWRLGKLLEGLQLSESLAVHYERILTEPEGGHYELNLAANEVVLAARLENPTLDVAQMKRICVQACEPSSGSELLVSNAGKILLSIENYRGRPITAHFIESLYARLVEGISIREAHEAEGRGADTVDGLRNKALGSFCASLWPRGADNTGLGDPFVGVCGGSVCGNHTVIDALIALHFFKTFRLFPAGNDVFAYLMYFLVLHRAGYHFLAHVPVVELMYAGKACDTPGRCLPCEPGDLAVECDGYHDWTRFFECAVELLAGEQNRLVSKLDGMSRRRERFRAIIDADESLNFRQREVLLEAILHSNAEFTYAIHVRRYDVSYPCARSDFARLLDTGFLRQHDDGIRHFFVASENFNQLFLVYLKEHCNQAFYQYYHEDGTLRDEYKSAGDVVCAYNEGVGFYEKSLLDKTYIEHYDFRRTSIADCDGPRTHSWLKDGIEPA